MPDLPPNPQSSTTFIPVSPWSRNGSEVTSPDQIDDDLKNGFAPPTISTPDLECGGLPPLFHLRHSAKLYFWRA
jgi:hypothetical protein